MLTLTARVGDDIVLPKVIGYTTEEMRIVLRDIRGCQARIGIEAGPNVLIYRGKVLQRLEREAKEFGIHFDQYLGHNQAAKILGVKVEDYLRSMGITKPTLHYRL